MFMTAKNKAGRAKENNVQELHQPYKQVLKLSIKPLYNVPALG